MATLFSVTTHILTNVVLNPCNLEGWGLGRELPSSWTFICNNHTSAALSKEFHESAVWVGWCPSCSNGLCTPGGMPELSLLTVVITLMCWIWLLLLLQQRSFSLYPDWWPGCRRRYGRWYVSSAKLLMLPPLYWQRSGTKWSEKGNPPRSNNNEYLLPKKTALAGTCCFSISDFSYNAQGQLDFMYEELERISVIYVLVMVACKDHAFCESYLVSIVNNYVPTSNCPMYTNWTLKLFQPVHVCFVLWHSAKKQGGLVEACIKKLRTYRGLWMGQSEEGSFFKVAF